MTENERLKKIRECLDFTQKEMAEKIGLKQGSYSDVERGKATVSNYVKLSLEKNLHINKEWLEGGTGEMFQKERVKRDIGKSVTPGAIRLYRSDNFDANSTYEELIIPGYSDCEIAIENYGDMMEPDLFSGDIMLLKEWDDAFVEFGQTYFIITNHNNKMIRKIFPKEGNETYLLEALNEKYPPITLNRADIKMLYIIKGKIGRKTI